MQYFVFLKGINVSGKRTVAMGQLRQELSASGYANVSTYLNSGNVLLQSEGSAAELAGPIATAIQKVCGFSVEIVIRTRPELVQAMAQGPWVGEGEADKSKLLIYFLSRAVEPERFAELAKHPKIIERHWGRGDHLFVEYEKGIAASHMTAAYIDKTLACVSTGRNLNTIQALLERTE